MDQLRQAFPPKPVFTESSLEDLSGKVYMVTGANAGVGKELSRLLYSRNATVYLAARSQEKADSAIEWIKSQQPDSKGTLHFISLQLDDLSTIKATAEEFLSKESKLNVLFNNAGVMFPPKGSKTKQGYELQLGTNCLGHHLLTELLTPALEESVKTSPAGSTRVIFVASSAAPLMSPTGGVPLDAMDKVYSQQTYYGISKAGNVLQAIDYHRRHPDIVAISLNPGNLRSELQRHMVGIQKFVIDMILYPAVNGAYTELYAGLAPNVKDLKPSQWVIPFGRVGELRKDLAVSGLAQEENGNGMAKRFYEWSVEQTKQYA